MSYDQKCYDLAEAFLSDVQNPVKHEDAHKLAQDIQSVIEDYLDELERAEPEAPTEPDVDTDHVLDRGSDDVPPALRAQHEREMKNVLHMGKVMDRLFPERAK